MLSDAVCVCTGISCMAQDCSLHMHEDFVLPLLPAEELKDKYRRYLFRDYIEVGVCGWVARGYARAFGCYIEGRVCNICLVSPCAEGFMK